MRVIKGNIPADSITYNIHQVNYTDCYLCRAAISDEVTPDDILVKFWTEMPKWVEWLLNLRNVLVKIVGLKGKEDSSTDRLENAIRNDGEHSLMSVAGKTDKETVVRMTDKHLTVYLSVYKEKTEDASYLIYISTLVTFHKRLGNFYFFVIYPFHHIIVRNMLKNIIKKFLKQDK